MSATRNSVPKTNRSMGNEGSYTTAATVIPSLCSRSSSRPEPWGARADTLGRRATDDPKFTVRTVVVISAIALLLIAEVLAFMSLYYKVDTRDVRDTVWRLPNRWDLRHDS